MRKDEERIASILMDLQLRRDRGELVDPEQVLRENPDLESELGECLEVLEVLATKLPAPVSVRLTHPSLRDLPPDRYSDFELVGEGGMGIVYLAVDTDLNREVAFKVVRAHARDEGATPPSPLQVRLPDADTPASRAFETLKARFLQEAWVTGGLDHPGIVPVYELGRTKDGVPYYTMRFVRGRRTLRDAIAEADDLPARLGLLEPFLKVCDTVHYAHTLGLCHRDLKPANIALGEFGEAVVLDWGLAKRIDQGTGGDEAWLKRMEEHRAATELETAAGAIGTPGYMSPESASGRLAEVDQRSDVYSLGAMLFEILTGALPFPVRSLRELVERLEREAPPEPREVDPAIPRPLSTICASALARSPAERPENAGALAVAVRAWQRDSEVDSEARALLDAAELSLEEARDLSGEALLTRLDGVAGPVARVLELRPGDARAEALVKASAKLRSRALEEREKEARRAVLRKSMLGALLLLAVGAVVVSLLLESRRRLAVELRDETAVYALVNASRAERGDPVLALLLAREAARLRMDPTTLSHLHRSVTRSRWRRTLRGHAAGLQRVRFSPDGRFVATASTDGAVILREVANPQYLVRLEHEAGVSGIDWTQDGRGILTACADGTARLFNRDGAEVLRYEGHPGAVKDVVTDPAGELLLTVCGGVEDGAARLYASSGELVAALPGHRGGATIGAFSPGGEILLTVDGHGTLRTWNREGALLRAFVGHQGLVYRASFSPGTRKVITCSADGTARIWDLEGDDHVVLREELKPGQNEFEVQIGAARFLPDGKGVVTAAFSGRIAFWTLAGDLTHEFESRELGPGATVTALVCSPDGTRLGWTQADGSVHLCRLRGSRPERIGAHAGSAFDLDFSPDGRLLATASVDATAMLWSTEVEEVATHRGAPSGVRCLATDASGQRYAVGRANGRAELWSVEGELIADLPGHGQSINSIAWSPGDDRFATSSADGTVREWNRDGSPRGIAVRHEGQVGVVSYSGDGKWLAAATLDGFLYLRKSDGSAPTKVRAHDREIHCLEFAPDSRSVLTAGSDGFAREFAVTGERLLELSADTQPVPLARFSPDGELILTGSMDGGVRIWQRNGELVRTISGHTSFVINGGFSPDGSRFFTVSADGAGRLYRRDGDTLAVLEGHDGWVVDGAFSEDGRTLATASWDGTARLWDSAGRCTGVLEGHQEDIWAVAIAGALVLTGSDDGTLKLWYHRTADLLRLADHRAGREFTGEERQRYRSLLAR